MRMRDHGLDMDCVAVATAERTIEKAFQVCKIVLSCLIRSLCHFFMFG